MIYEGLAADSKVGLKTLAPREVEVETQDHQWYTMRILPCSTVEKPIDGVVVTCC